MRGQIALFLQLHDFLHVCVGFEDFNIVEFDDAGHVVHTTDLIVVRDLMKHMFLGEVLVCNIFQEWWIKPSDISWSFSCLIFG